MTGSQLRYFLQRRGITTAEAARTLGCSERAVRDYFSQPELRRFVENAVRGAFPELFEGSRSIAVDRENEDSETMASMRLQPAAQIIARHGVEKLRRVFTHAGPRDDSNDIRHLLYLNDVGELLAADNVYWNIDSEGTQEDKELCGVLKTITSGQKFSSAIENALITRNYFDDLANDASGKYSHSCFAFDEIFLTVTSCGEVRGKGRELRANLNSVLVAVSTDVAQFRYGWFRKSFFGVVAWMNGDTENELTREKVREFNRIAETGG